MNQKRKLLLTKEQRHQIYTEALKMYLEHVEEQKKQDKPTFRGMCIMLEHAGVNLRINLNPEFLRAIDPFDFPWQYPEFNMHAVPKEDQDDLGYWFPVEKSKPRIKIFEQIIKETSE